MAVLFTEGVRILQEAQCSVLLDLDLRTSSLIFDLAGKFPKPKSVQGIPGDATVSRNEKHWLYNCCLVAKSCLTLWDPMDYNPPGSYLWDFPGKNSGAGYHSFSKGSSRYRDRTQVIVLLHTEALGASLIAQLVKNPPLVEETPVRFLGQEDPLEKG